MAIYTGPGTLGARFQPPREGTYHRQTERINIGPDPDAVGLARHSSAAPALGRGNSINNPIGPIAGSGFVQTMTVGTDANYNGRNRTKRALRARISERRQLYRELAEAHRHVAHLWSEAASRLHGARREADACGEPAAELYRLGILAEEQSAAHLREINSLREAMRHTYQHLTQQDDQ